MMKIITWCRVELRGWIQGSDSQSRHNTEWQIGVVDVHWDKILICHAWLSPWPPSHITHDHFCDGGHHVTAGMVTSHRQDSSAWTLTHPALISCPGCPPGSHHSASTASAWLTSQNYIQIFLEISANLKNLGNFLHLTLLLNCFSLNNHCKIGKYDFLWSEISYRQLI